MADDATQTLAGMKCAICGCTENLKKCARCKVIYYCSREHQIQDWRTHKGTCGKKQTGKSEMSSRPSFAESQKACSNSPPPAREQPQNPDRTADAIPFDTRPFKSMPFPQPPSTELEHLPEFVATQLKSKGFSVIDGILNEEKCERVLSEVKSMEKNGIMKSGRLAGGTTSAREEEKVVNASIRSDKLVWLEGTEVAYPALGDLLVDVMDYIVAHSVAFLGGEYIISGRTKAMATCYPGNDTAYHRHVDNPNNDGRCITCICYLNKGWDPQNHGGFMRAFPSSLGKGEYIDVAPVMNRMLFFWSDSRTPHEVHPSKKERYAVTVWYFDQKERENAKLRSVNEDISRVRDEIAMLDIRKKEVEKAVLQQEIENQATKAVGHLSQSEIEALSALVKDHPDPRSLLSGLGIAPSIVTHLMQKLQLT